MFGFDINAFGAPVAADVWDLALLPVVAALIGWITNYIAVKMLFHPRRPVRLLFFTLQGVFPKRQQVVAQKLGKLVATELLSSDDVLESIKKSVKSPEFISRLAPRVEAFVTEELPKELPMLRMFLTADILNMIKGAILKMIDPLMDQLLAALGGSLAQDLKIEQIVEEKVAKFSSDKLEEILLEIMRKEFKFIELIGGVLGFAIGLVQVAVLVWL